jgi:hypothetical protein
MGARGGKSEVAVAALAWNKARKVARASTAIRPYKLKGCLRFIMLYPFSRDRKCKSLNA